MRPAANSRLCFSHVEKLLSGHAGVSVEVPKVPHHVDASDGELQTHGTQGTRDQFCPSAAIITRSKVFSQTKKKKLLEYWGLENIYRIWMELLAPPPTKSLLLVAAHFMSTSLLRSSFNVVHIHNTASFISLNTHYKEKASLCFSLVRTEFVCPTPSANGHAGKRT